MRKGKLAVFHGKGRKIDITEQVLPGLKEGEILVRNEYTTLCKSDVNTYSGKRQERTPTILGHEIIGTIEEFGPGSSTRDARGNPLSVGDRITWAIYASDPHSELSRRGIPQKGEALFKYGHEAITPESSFHGGLGTYIILRPHTPIVKIIKDLPLPVMAVINCAVATVAGALRLAGDSRDKIILVSGAGMLGCMACAMSRTFGAREVVAVDVDGQRLEEVQRYGAGFSLSADPDGYEQLQRKLGRPKAVDLVLELSGAAAAMEQTLDLLKVGGTAVWVGATFPQEKIRIDAESIIRNLYTIKGLHNYNQDDLVTAVEFMENTYRIYPYDELIYSHFTLDQVNEAFAYALRKNPFRVGLDLRGGHPG